MSMQLVRRRAIDSAALVLSVALGLSVGSIGCGGNNSSSSPDAGTAGATGSKAGSGGSKAGSGGSSGSGGAKAGAGGASGASSGTGGKSGSGGSSASCASPGGADTSKSANTHCTDSSGKMMTQETGQCVPDTGSDTGSDADAGPLGGVLGGDYGDTNYGTTAFDDDCKYKVSWTSTPICDNTNVTFTVTVTKTAGGDAVTGAQPYIEAFKVDGQMVHFPAATNQKPTEKGNGVYDVGPVEFNESGQWIVRFHLFEMCSDSPDDSPHGHAAFYVNVP